jgi:hypothetical protein
MYFNYQEYLDSLPDDVEEINIDFKAVTYIPELTRFTHLTCLNVCNNLLKKLPDLPLSLKILYCPNNYLKELPELPPTLISLFCWNNRLTKLPRLPSTLRKLYCSHNRLTILPELPPFLNQFGFNNNPLIYQYNHLHCINDTNRILFKFRFLFYCLKFKNQFRNWLWERIRRPKIERQCHPLKIAEFLEQGVDIMDLDQYLDQYLDW